MTFILFLQSCGLWENFTTYFNRYYNTRQSFLEAEEAMEENKSRDLFEFKEPTLPSKARTSLDNVIELSSKILQFNKESAYFDEALFMIGKSYFYQGNYTKALRKFEELALLSDTELKLENKLWIAKSEFQMRRFDEAMELLEEVKQQAIEEDNEEIIRDAYLAEIRYYNYRENYADAIRTGIKLLEVSEDDELNAQLSYELGKLYVELNEFDKAAEYFARVDDYSPSFDTEFEAQLELAKVQKELGLMEQSLELLDDLRSEVKYKNQFDKIDLELANIEFGKGNIIDALNLYLEVDTTYPGTESAGIAAFKRAEIVEKTFSDLDSADVLYKRIATTKAPVELKDIAREKSNVFRKLQTYFANIEKFTQEYSYALDSTLYVQDSTLFADYIERRDSISLLMKEMQELEGSDFDSSKYALNEEQPFLQQPTKSTLPIDTLASRIVLNKYELGNLYLGELELPDSAFNYYIDIIDNYPESRLYPNTLYSLGTYYSTINDSVKSDSLFNYVYDNFKENKIVNAAAKKLGKDIIQLDIDPAQKLFVDSEAFYDSSKYNLAINSYFTLAAEYPESPYAAKSLYSIGFILENDLQLKDSAASVYDSLSTKYGMSTYARSISKKLNFYKTVQRQINDSLNALQRKMADSLKADSIGIEVSELNRAGVNELAGADSIKQDSLSILSSDNLESANDSLSALEKERGLNPLAPNKIQQADSVKPKDEKPKRRGRPRGKK